MDRLDTDRSLTIAFLGCLVIACSSPVTQKSHILDARLDETEHVEILNPSPSLTTGVPVEELIDDHEDDVVAAGGEDVDVEEDTTASSDPEVPRNDFRWRQRDLRDTLTTVNSEIIRIASDNTDADTETPVVAHATVEPRTATALDRARVSAVRVTIQVGVPRESGTNQTERLRIALCPDVPENGDWSFHNLTEKCFISTFVEAASASNWDGSIDPDADWTWSSYRTFVFRDEEWGVPLSSFYPDDGFSNSIKHFAILPGDDTDPLTDGIFIAGVELSVCSGSDERCELRYRNPCVHRWVQWHGTVIPGAYLARQFQFSPHSIHGDEARCVYVHTYSGDGGTDGGNIFLQIPTTDHWKSESGPLPVHTMQWLTQQGTNGGETHFVPENGHEDFDTDDDVLEVLLQFDDYENFGDDTDSSADDTRTFYGATLYDACATCNRYHWMGYISRDTYRLRNGSDDAWIPSAISVYAFNPGASNFLIDEPYCSRESVSFHERGATSPDGIDFVGDITLSSDASEGVEVWPSRGEPRSLEETPCPAFADIRFGEDYPDNGMINAF
ncbi:MAG: hypothetical protein HY465_05975 [Deltaproteobacteria bacterium]|nr:hypothetical protein [Deltaproteobacteria bacterium]